MDYDYSVVAGIFEHVLCTIWYSWDLVEGVNAMFYVD